MMAVMTMQPLKTKEQLTEVVERVLEAMRAGFKQHAGDVELVDVEPESGKVSVRLQGACVGCAMANLTLKAGIEDTLKMMVPEVTEVVEVQ